MITSQFSTALLIWLFKSQRYSLTGIKQFHKIGFHRQYLSFGSNFWIKHNMVFKIGWMRKRTLRGRLEGHLSSGGTQDTSVRLNGCPVSLPLSLNWQQLASKSPLIRFKQCKATLGIMMPVGTKLQIWWKEQISTQQKREKKLNSLTRSFLLWFLNQPFLRLVLVD